MDCLTPQAHSWSLQACGLAPSLGLPRDARPAPCTLSLNPVGLPSPAQSQVTCTSPQPERQPGPAPRLRPLQDTDSVLLVHCCAPRTRTPGLQQSHRLPTSHLSKDPTRQRTLVSPRVWPNSGRPGQGWAGENDPARTPQGSRLLLPPSPGPGSCWADSHRMKGGYARNASEMFSPIISLATTIITATFIWHPLYTGHCAEGEASEKGVTVSAFLVGRD